MTDKMREEFEEFLRAGQISTLRNEFGYASISADLAWKAWQASRSAVVVDLSGVNVENYGDGILHLNYSDVLLAIESSGASVFVKVRA